MNPSSAAAGQTPVLCNMFRINEVPSWNSGSLSISLTASWFLEIRDVSFILNGVQYSKPTRQ